MSESVVLLRLSSMGDILLTGELITNLRLAYPQHELIFVTREKFADVARMLSVDRVIALPEPVSIRSLWDCSQYLSDLNVSLLVDLHANLRTMLLRNWIASMQTLIYPKRRFERSRMVQYGGETAPPLSVLQQYRQPLLDARIPTPATYPTIRIPEVHQLRGKRHNRIVLAPGAAHATKRWPVESFVALAEILKRELQCEITWAVGSSDRVLLEPYLETLSRDTILVGETLSQLSIHTAESMLTISNDSGVMHLSSALRTPVLAIFGPTHPSLGFAPTGHFDEIAQRNLFCRPCSLHGKKRCWRDQQYCFTQLTPEIVSAQGIRMFHEQEKRRPAIILDRDGTLIENRHYNADPRSISYLPGAIDLIKRAKSAGFAVLIVSNQSGVARGFFTYEQAEIMNAGLVEQLREAGASVDASLFCPHHPTEGPPSEFRRSCTCRKPAAGMVLDVAQSLSLDLGRLQVVGDSLDDMGLGLVLGSNGLLVRTGHGMKSEQQLRNQKPRADIAIVDDLVAGIDELGL